MDIISDIKFLKNSLNDIKKKASELNKEWKREMDKQKLINEMNKKIDELKNEFSEKIAALDEKKPYEISYPNDGEKVWSFDCYLGSLINGFFNIEDRADRHSYKTGLLFDSYKEVNQFLKEQTLIKKIKCWAKEQQGDWEPDWSNTNQRKYYVDVYRLNKKIICGWCWGHDKLPKLPYFKSEEIVRACIDEFGDEILEVFC